jgi:hypothetical protein
MTKDARLDLGRYVSNPFNRQGQVSKKLDFHDLFRSKPATGDYPWNPSRFSERDLIKRMMTRKETLNPDLNFVGNAPFFDGNQNGVTPAYELFAGLVALTDLKITTFMKVVVKLRNAHKTNLILILGGWRHINSVLR